MAAARPDFRSARTAPWHAPPDSKLQAPVLPDTGSPGLDLQASRDRAPLARIHAAARPRRRDSACAPRGEPPSPRPARQLVPPDRTAAPEPRPRQCAATPFLRPPPLPLEQRPVRSPDVGADGPPPSGKGGPDPSSRMRGGIGPVQEPTRACHAVTRPFAIGPAEMNGLTRRSRGRPNARHDRWHRGQLLDHELTPRSGLVRNAG